MSVLLSDEPTLNDLLGRMDLAQEIGDTIASCHPPCVLGIHGDWGSGKTSFLHVLHHYLFGKCPQAASPLQETVNSDQWPGWKRKDHIAVIWFEAWRYQHEVAPVVALLHEIRAQLPTASKLLEKSKKLGEVAVKSALFSMESVTKLIGLQASKVQEVGEKWEKDHLAEQLPSHTLRQFLEDALKKLLPRDDNARLVILVDDLDRCEPQAAYRLLEGIKIYLNLPNCVFVLGVNQASIEASLAEQLAKEKADKPNEEAKQRARDYLDKICKNFWHLPAFQDLGYLVDFWLDRALRETPTFAEVEKVAIGRLIQDHRCLPANPRRIKAFVNTLVRFLIHIAQKHTERFGLLYETCIVLAYLYQFHPEIYRVLEWHPVFYNELYTWV